VEIDAEAVKEVIAAPCLEIAAPGLLVVAHLGPRAIKLGGVNVGSDRKFGGARRERQERREKKCLLHV